LDRRSRAQAIRDWAFNLKLNLLNLRPNLNLSPNLNPSLNLNLRLNLKWGRELRKRNGLKSRLRSKTKRFTSVPGWY